MNKYLKEFLRRGFLFSGLGPVIIGIIYIILDKTVDNFNLSGYEAFCGIISTYIIAFVQAGASVLNQIEEWSAAKSLLYHFLILYIVYVLCYILNSWIPFKIEMVILFTIIFVVSYFVIWTTVYLIVKNTSKKLNNKLK